MLNILSIPFIFFLFWSEGGLLFCYFNGSFSRAEIWSFFISDVHFGEITRYDCAAGYPLYEITSSGLTQAVEKVLPSLLHFIVRFLAWFTPSTMRVMSQNCRYRSCTYGMFVICLFFSKFLDVNAWWSFHVFRFYRQTKFWSNWDWLGCIPVNLKIQVHDINGLPVTGVDISLSELRAVQDRRHCSLEVMLPWIVRYRLAILVYCLSL